MLKLRQDSVAIKSMGLGIIQDWIQAQQHYLLVVVGN